jgi:hypothetical protein
MSEDSGKFARPPRHAIFPRPRCLAGLLHAAQILLQAASVHSLTSAHLHARPDRILGWFRALWSNASRTQLTLGLLLLLATIVLALRVQVPIVVVNTDVGFDEGYAAGMALRVLEGKGLPYVDGASHRGPLFYWTLSAATWLGGKYTWHGFRALSLVAFLASTLLMFGAGWAARRPWAGAIGAAFYTYVMCFALHPNDTVGLHAEPLAVPCLMASLLFAALGVCRTKTLRTFALFAACSGVTALMAGLMKQTVLMCVAPMGLWLVAHAYMKEGWTRRQRRMATLALPAGWVGLGLFVIGLYAAAGEVHTLYYWFWKYNADVFAQTSDFDHPVSVLQDWLIQGPWWAIGWALLVIGNVTHLVGRLFAPAGPRGRLSELGFHVAVTLLAITTMAAAAVGLRLFPHYFLIAIASAGLLLGVGVGERLSFRTTSGRASAVVATLLFLAFVGASTETRASIIRKEKREGLGWFDSANTELCSLVQTYSKPDEPIFIWGFDADLYVDCARRPASRFVYMTLVLGTVPPFWAVRKPEYVAENAPEILLDELQTQKPPVILDLKKRIHGFSMTVLPSLKKLLRDDYCLVRTIPVEDGRKANAYVRKDLGACKRTPKRHGAKARSLKGLETANGRAMSRPSIAP